MSLTARLAGWAATRGQRRALLFLADGVREAGELSFAELHRAALGVAGALAAQGVAGRPVLVLPRQPLAFAIAFLGCLYADAIAVPCSTGPRGRGWDRLRGILADAAPAAALGDAEVAELLERIAAAGVPAWRLDALQAAPLPAPVATAPEAPALLQYTSGSTAAPKGVVVTHGNLAANLAMLQAGFAVREDSVYLSWLPLHHDMGLIANLLAALWCGVPCVLMPPLAFYQQPRRWLAAIGRYGATISGAPNFAYELCVRRRPRMDLAGLDLSRWRLAFCGAEQVRAGTMRRFAAAFAEAGFDAAALFPCYGLAEATVFVAGSRPGGGMALGRDAAGAEAVSCGRALPGEEVLIVDPGSRQVLPDGEVGELWLRGPHVAAGYWGQPAASEPVFRAALAPDDGRRFLRTGDLGWRRDGDLFFKGRLKDLIVWHGGNLHPEDLEASAAESHPLLAPASAAFAVEAEDAEGVVLVQEVQRGASPAAAEAAAALQALAAALAEAHGVTLHDALLVPPGAIPRTTSGKVQRQACRRRYLAGDLVVLARLRVPLPASQQAP